MKELLRALVGGAVDFTLEVKSINEEYVATSPQRTKRYGTYMSARSVSNEFPWRSMSSVMACLCSWGTWEDLVCAGCMR